MAKLILHPLGGAGQEFPLGPASVLGRSPQADFILESPQVSRRHALIVEQGGKYFLKDLGSSNGTLVNGSPIRAVTRLRAGDRIQIGEATLEFREEEPASPGGAETAAAPSGTDLFQPQKLGKFQLQKRLGTGGMGEVYLAKDLESGRQAAVKLVRADAGKGDFPLELLHSREAALAQQIRHPNVIQIFEYGLAEHRPFISMEYVSGKSLKQVLAERRLEADEALEIIRQVACGLYAAHREGVVHCDIKPANILFCGPEAPGHEPGREGGGEPPSNGREAAGCLEFSNPTGPTGPAVAEESPRQEKNRYEPALLAEIGRRSALSPWSGLESLPPFERMAELRYLESCLDRLEEGRGALVLIEGEAGAGKKLLIAEFLKRAAASLQAPPVLEADAGAPETLPPPARLAESRAPAILRLLKIGSVDSRSVAAVKRLAALIAERPLLMLGDFTPEEARHNPALLELLRLTGAPVKRLYLRPLTEYQILGYLQKLLLGIVNAAQLAGDLYRLSGGNFSALVKTLQDFARRGFFTALAGGGETMALRYHPKAREFELEEGKRHFEIFRRLGKLEQALLEQAAFIGNSFYFDLLARCSSIETTTLFLFLKGFLSEGLLVDQGKTWYGFANPSFRQFLAGRLPVERQAAVQHHRQIAQLLEQAPVPDSVPLCRLRAAHFQGCQEIVPAVRSLLRGAHLARIDYQSGVMMELYHEVLRLYRQAAKRRSTIREINAILQAEIGGDGNWYEILGKLAAEDLSPRLKIADFGISFRALRSQPGGDAAPGGTPRYMAPERGTDLDGQPKLDVFSLGIIAYELAAGEPPFPELQGMEAFKAYRQKPIAVPRRAVERFPRGFEEVLRGMLERDPEKRWDAERVIAAATRLRWRSRHARSK